MYSDRLSKTTDLQVHAQTETVCRFKFLLKLQEVIANVSEYLHILSISLTSNDRMVSLKQDSLINYKTIDCLSFWNKNT